MDEDKNPSNLPPAGSAGPVSMPSNPDVPNAAGRVIASTPDVVTPPAPDVSGANQAHPFFANHPTQTFNTDAGDIILNPVGGKPKQNKRPFIIGGAILAVILVAVSVFLIINGSLQNRDSANLSKAGKSFYRYANYLLYEKDSDAELGEDYQRWQSYAFNHQLEQDRESYWSTALELLNHTVEVYPDDADPAVLSNLRNYQQNFQFFVIYRSLNELDDNEVFNLYLSDGKGLADGYIENYYETNLLNLSADAKAYSEARMTEYLALTEYLSVYDAAGCLNYDGVVLECPNLDVEAISQLQNTISAGAEEAESIISSLETAIVSDCWRLSKQIMSVDGSKND